MPSRRVVPLLLTAACAVGALAAAPAAVAAPAVPAVKLPTYVALGDSYAAGFGLGAPATPTGKPVPGCAQTSLDYPHRLAAQLGLRLVDASCSGAKTDDFFGRQAVSGPSPVPQIDVVIKQQPAVVSITIGGNDWGFSAVSASCLALSPTGPLILHPTFSTCQSYFASLPAAQNLPSPANIAATGLKVHAAIAAVQKASPSSQIVVVDYPAIAPNAANTPAGGCFAAEALPPGLPFASRLPFTDSDTPFLQQTQARLNSAIGKAATSLGAAFVDVYKASLAHSACAPEAARWVEPVVPEGGGTNSLHPSLAGTAAITRFVAPVVKDLLNPAS